MYSFSDCYKVPKDSDLRKFGIYCIENKVNGRQYVGSTTQMFFQRMQNHIRDLKKNKHHSVKLQGCFNKHNPDDYHVKILEILETRSNEIIQIREQFWLDNLQPFYNVQKESYFHAGFQKSENTKKKQVERCRLRLKDKDVGVSYFPRDKTWGVKISVGTFEICALGRYKTKEEALAARKQAESVFWTEEFDALSIEEQKEFAQRYQKSKVANNCTSGYRYISKANDRAKCWRVEYKHERVGSFKTLEEAVKCRDEFLAKYNLF